MATTHATLPKGTPVHPRKMHGLGGQFAPVLLTRPVTGVFFINEKFYVYYFPTPINGYMGFQVHYSDFLFFQTK